MAKKEAKSSSSIEEKIVLDFPTKMVVLKIKNFDTDVDVDSIINTQHHNIIGEMLVIPVIFNRVGNLKADAEAILSEAKLDFDIFFAQKQEEMRKALTFDTTDAKGNPKVDKPTEGKIENAVMMTTEYRIKKKRIIDLKKNFDYVDSLYWAVKDKSAKLNFMSAKIKPEDFEKEIVEGTLHGIEILVRPKSIAA